MKKTYKQIQFRLGSSIDDAINQLKTAGDYTCGSFNDIMLYSDVDDIDSAYVKITGKTKDVIDDEIKKENQRYQTEEKLYQLLTPQLIKAYEQKALEILDPKYISKWNQFIPHRLSDIYRGFELQSALDIIQQLNANCHFDVAKEIIQNQGHSGHSYHLVCAIIKLFSDNGQDFVNYLNN